MNTRDKLILFPCGGNAIEALDCVDKAKFDIIGFVDDDKEKIGSIVCGIEVFDRSIFKDEPEALVLAVQGSPNSFRDREGIINDLVDRKRFATVVHPKASISEFSRLGRNCLIMEGVVLKVNSIVKDNVCILPNTVLHHDSIIGKNSLIGSNVVIAGYSIIGESCYIGSGARIINGIKIGNRSLIGMGSNVLKDVAHDTIVAGNPAKLI